MTTTLFGGRSLAFGLLLLAAIVTGPSAYAQGTRVGATFYPRPADGLTNRFPGVTYDGANDAYLVTWTGFLPYPQVNHRVGARFVGPTGAVLSQPETVSFGLGGPAAAACGPQINVCLVAWIQEPSTMMGRFLRYANGSVTFLTNPFVINSNGAPKHTVAPPAVAYSSAAQEFLVTWAEYGNSLDVKGQRVSGNGALAGAEIPLAVSGFWESFPSVAYNSQRNEYFVSNYQELPGNVASVAGRRVQPGTGAVLGGNTFWGASAMASYPEVAYNSRTNQYLAVSWGMASGVWMLNGLLADANANPLGGVLPLAVRGGGDGIGITYNPVSDNYFAVYQSQSNDEMWGVTIGPGGVPTAQFQVTVSGTRLTVQPRPASSTRVRQFLAVASNQYTGVMAQQVQDGSAPPPPPPPPPPPVTTPRMAVDGPKVGDNVRGAGFTISGWALDLGAPSGTGVDQIDVWGSSIAGGNPFFVGSVQPAVTRIDVAAVFGQRFTLSGYSLPARLKPGTYDLHVFARSTVTGTFNNSRVVRIIVTGTRASATSDVDGDGKVDISVYRPANGMWHTLESRTNFATASMNQWGMPGDVPVSGDFDGDGKADRTVYRTATGTFYTLKSTGAFATALGVAVGGPGWIPAPADFDNDGKTDYAAYNPQTSQWQGLLSSSSYTSSISTVWGIPGDAPVPADYDGDGRADIAVYRASTSYWFILTSSSGFANVLLLRAGGPAWEPVPGDFDGDGKVEAAVYNKTSGLWYALKSGSGYTQSISIVWGGSGYLPIRGDFDGDGKSDLAVYQPSTAGWFIRLSSTGYTKTVVAYWGGAGFVPMGFIP